MGKKTRARARKGRVRASRRNGPGAAERAQKQVLQVGTSPGVVRLQFQRPVQAINLTVAEAAQLAQALFQGARSAHDAQQRRLAGLAPTPVADALDAAPRVVGPDGVPAPRPAVVAPRDPDKA